MGPCVLCINNSSGVFIMSSFLRDRAYGKEIEKRVLSKIEEYFEGYGIRFEANDIRGNDRGVDIYGLVENFVVFSIDVKSYKKPSCDGVRFDGVFVETLLPKSGRPGWLYDESNLTTHYAFAIGCDENYGFENIIFIDRYTLRNIVNEHIYNNCKKIKKTTAHGYIIGYDELINNGGVYIC